MEISLSPRVQRSRTRVGVAMPLAVANGVKNGASVRGECIARRVGAARPRRFLETGALENRCRSIALGKVFVRCGRRQKNGHWRMSAVTVARYNDAGAAENALNPPINNRAARENDVRARKRSAGRKNGRAAFGGRRVGMAAATVSANIMSIIGKMEWRRDARNRIK